jgi:hypothetical protein
MRADVCVRLERGARGSGPRILLKPDGFSLAKLFPKLAEVDVLSDLAWLELDALLVACDSEAELDPSELPASMRGGLPPTSDGSSRVKLVRGLNLLAPLRPSSLPSGGMLAQGLERVRTAFGVQSDALDLRGTLGRSLADLRLTAALPPIDPRRAPPWLKSGQIGLAISGQPSLGFDGRVTVDVEGDTLTFLLAAALRREGAAPVIQLRGGLETEAPWESPFGIEWLELHRAGLGLSLDAVGNFAPALSGKLVIGRKDLEVAAMVKINATGVPTGGMFFGKSEEGFALHDLLELQQRIASRAGGRSGVPGGIALSHLPDVALRRIELKLAARDFPDEHVRAGVTVGGDLFVSARRGGAPTRRVAGILGEIDREGLRAEGRLVAWQVGPLAFDESTVRILATRGEQRLVVEGGVDVLGKRQAVALRLGREQLEFDAEAALGRWNTAVHVTSPLDLDKPDFSALGALPAELLQELRGALESHVGAAVARFEAAVAAVETALGEAQRAGDERRKAAQARREALVRELQQARDDVAAAWREAELAKRVMNERLEIYVATPDSRPVLKEARKKAWEAARAIYELGRDSRKAIHEAKKAALDALPKPDDAPDVRKLLAEAEAFRQELERRRGERDGLLGVLRSVREFKQRNPGARILELRKGSFRSDLAALVNSRELPIDFEIVWLGKALSVERSLAFGDPAACAREIVASFLPERASR